MPEENTNTNGEGTENNNSDAEKNWQALRAKQEATEARAKKLLETTVSKYVKDVGLNPTEGIGSLISEKYVASLGDDVPSDEHFQQFLEANKYTDAIGSAPTNTENNLNALQSAGDQLRGSGEQPKPTDVSDLIAKAESEGRWNDAMNLKLANQVANTPGWN